MPISDLDNLVNADPAVITGEDKAHGAAVDSDKNLHVEVHGNDQAGNDKTLRFADEGSAHVGFNATIDSNNYSAGTPVSAYLGTPLENSLVPGSALPAIPGDTWIAAGWTPVKDVSALGFEAFSSALGKGFALWSSDGGATLSRYEATLFQGSGAFTDPPQGSTHVRIAFQNLSAGSNTFKLNTVLRYQSQGHFMAPVNAPLDASFPAALSKSVITGQKPDSTFDNVRIQGLEPTNSTSTPLNASATWRGLWFKWQNSYLKLGISVNSDVSGSLWIDFSDVETPVDGDESSVSTSLFYAYDPAVETLFREQVPVQSKWVRVRYTNGIAAQATFTFNSVLLNADPGSLALQLKTLPVRGQLVSVVRSVPALMNAAGNALQEVPISSLGNPKNSIDEIHDDILVEPLSSALASQTVVGTTATRLDPSPLANRRVISVSNDGPGRVAVGHSSGITFDSGSIRIPVGSSKTFGVDAGIPFWGIVENLGGSQTLLNRNPASASGTATNPNNAISSNNSYANITANAQTVNATGFTAGTTNPLVSVRLGIEANKQASQNETVAFQNSVTGNAGNVGSVATSATMTGVNGHVYIAAISTENQNATVTGIAGLSLTWTFLQTVTAGGTRKVEVWYAVGNVSVTTSVVTASLSQNGTNSHIAVSRYSNVDNVSPIQDSITATGNNTTPTTAALACTNKGMSYLAVVFGNNTMTAGSGYTLISSEKSASGTVDGLGTERKPITSTGTETPTANLTEGSAKWRAIGLTLTPAPAVDPIVTLSYTLSAVPGATSANLTFSSSSDTTQYVDITTDRVWVVGDIPNVNVIATGQTISAAAANIDLVFLELIDSTGSSSRVSVWQGAKAVT